MIISLGFNCFIGMALKNIMEIQPSLPFDSIQNHSNDGIINVYKILEKLNTQTIDITNFIKVNNNNINSLKFSLNHFYKSEHTQRYISKDEHVLDLYEIFNRRFIRLKQNFFHKNQPNLLIYKPRPEESDDVIYTGSKLITAFNKSNKLIILSRIAPRKKGTLKVSENIEFIRCGRSAQRVEALLSQYITPEIKKYYGKTIT